MLTFAQNSFVFSTRYSLSLPRQETTPARAASCSITSITRPAPVRSFTSSSSRCGQIIAGSTIHQRRLRRPRGPHISYARTSGARPRAGSCLPDHNHGPRRDDMPWAGTPSHPLARPSPLTGARRTCDPGPPRSSRGLRYCYVPGTAQIDLICAPQVMGADGPPPAHSEPPARSLIADADHRE